jgi:hypothetical protein
LALTLPLPFPGTISTSESESAFTVFTFFGGATSESDSSFATFLVGTFFAAGATFGGFSSSLSTLDKPATAALGFGFGLGSAAFFFAAVFDGLNSSSESSEP